MSEHGVMMDLRPGMRLLSAVCATEVVVVRAPATPIELCCGGHPMSADVGAERPSGVELSVKGAPQLGKRYEHAASGLELLCTKSGEGALTVDGELVPVKAAKALPSSD